MTPEEIIALITAAVSVVDALEKSGVASPVQATIAILDAHPMVVQARARVQAAIDAKFPEAKTP